MIAGRGPNRECPIRSPNGRAKSFSLKKGFRRLFNELIGSQLAHSPSSNQCLVPRASSPQRQNESEHTCGRNQSGHGTKKPSNRHSRPTDCIPSRPISPRRCVAWRACAKVSVKGSSPMHGMIRICFHDPPLILCAI